MQFATSLIAATALATSVLAHPGHDMRAEIAERAAFMQHSKRDLSHCAAKLKMRGLDKSAVSRRAAMMKDSRKKRSIAQNSPFLKARDVDTVLATSHLSADGFTTETDEAVIFAGNSSCILSPEVTEGPYYVAGEYVREDVTEDQEGVELVLDTQILDINTCEPVPDAMIEIWHCNSTGVYSGVVASGNGDISDLTNLDNTFLRGLQPTDDEGVAQFQTLFPGHYVGRTTHIHVLAHFNGTQYENGTYSGGYVSHVGQVFFDQDLITQVEAVEPYVSNTQALTTNAEDSIMAEEAATSDPVVEYSLIGSDISEGVFAWIAFGIDLTSELTVSAAATLYAEGGVANTNGPGGAGPGGNGTAPSGAPPGASGTVSAPASVSTSTTAAVSEVTDVANGCGA